MPANVNDIIRKLSPAASKSMFSLTWVSNAVRLRPAGVLIGSDPPNPGAVPAIDPTQPGKISFPTDAMCGSFPRAWGTPCNHHKTA